MKSELQKLFDLIEQAAHNSDSALHARTPEEWIEAIKVQKCKAEDEETKAQEYFSSVFNSGDGVYRP